MMGRKQEAGSTGQLAAPAALTERLQGDWL